MAKWIDPADQRKNRESHQKGSNERVSKAYGLPSGGRKGPSDAGPTGPGGKGREAPSRPLEAPSRAPDGRFPQAGWVRLAVAVRPSRAYTAGTPISPSYRGVDLDAAVCAVAAASRFPNTQCVRIYTDDLNAWTLAGKLRRQPWCHIVALDLADDYAQLLIEVARS